MKITVTPLTDMSLVHKACGSTLGTDTSNITFDAIMTCEHSPIRCLLFWVDMRDIPTFVSVHLVRHKIGVEHFVKSNRDDRGGSAKVDRDTPINHGMLINAQALVNMARRRLCMQAHPAARKVMQAIKDASPKELQKYLIPECEYRGNTCNELRYCGKPNMRPVWKSHDRENKNVEDHRVQGLGEGDRGRSLPVPAAA